MWYSQIISFLYYRENGGVQFEMINLNSRANWYEDDKLGECGCVHITTCDVNHIFPLKKPSTKNKVVLLGVVEI